MLSTKDIKVQEGSGKVSKTIKPGNLIAKINDITLQPSKSNPDALFLVLHLESEPVDGDFEGFYIDPNNPAKGRHLGQVGKVKFSQYAYKDMTTKSGYFVSRNNQILRDVASLANALGCREELDSLGADTIEAFVKNAARVLCNNVMLKWCIGGSAYVKDGSEYKDYSLHLPKYNKAVTTPNFGKLDEKITQFDAATHIQDDTEKESQPVQEWGAAPSSPAAGSWKPTEFEL